MSEPRKILDADDARECLAAVARSGLSRVAWCHENRVNARSLNAWRLAVERSSRPRSATLQLVELVAGRDDQRGSGCRVRVDRFVVEVDPDFDDQHLARVLRVVTSC